MQKPAQKGHDDLLGGVHSGCSLFARRLGWNGLDCKLTAIRNLLRFLLAIGHLDHRKNLGRSWTGIGAHGFGVHRDIDVSVLDEGLELSGDIGVIGTATLIRLLDDQHY